MTIDRRFFIIQSNTVIRPLGTELYNSLIAGTKGLPEYAGSLQRCLVVCLAVNDANVIGSEATITASLSFTGDGQLVVRSETNSEGDSWEPLQSQLDAIAQYLGVAPSGGAVLIDDPLEGSDATFSIRGERGDANAAATPSVGIFWGVQEPNNTWWFLINEKVPLGGAETYGDFLTYPDGHFKIWERVCRMPLTQLRRSGLPLAICGMEYEDFPRGRIVFDVARQQFTVYADRRLQRGPAIRGILRAFCLEQMPHIVRSDEHYR